MCIKKVCTKTATLAIDRAGVLTCHIGNGSNMCTDMATLAMDRNVYRHRHGKTATEVGVAVVKGCSDGQVL